LVDEGESFRNRIQELQKYIKNLKVEIGLYDDELFKLQLPEEKF